MREAEAAGARRGDNEGETGAVFTLNGALFVARESRRRKTGRRVEGRESEVGMDGGREEPLVLSSSSGTAPD